MWRTWSLAVFHPYTPPIRWSYCGLKWGSVLLSHIVSIQTETDPIICKIKLIFYKWTCQSLSCGKVIHCRHVPNVFIHTVCSARMKLSCHDYLKYKHIFKHVIYRIAEVSLLVSTAVLTLWWFLIKICRITVELLARFLINPINLWSSL